MSGDSFGGKPRTQLIAKLRSGDFMMGLCNKPELEYFEQICITHTYKPLSAADKTPIKVQQAIISYEKRTGDTVPNNANMFQVIKNKTLNRLEALKQIPKKIKPDKASLWDDDYPGLSAADFNEDTDKYELSERNMEWLAKAGRDQVNEERICIIMGLPEEVEGSLKKWLSIAAYSMYRRSKQRGLMISEAAIYHNANAKGNPTAMKLIAMNKLGYSDKKENEQQDSESSIQQMFAAGREATKAKLFQFHGLQPGDAAPTEEGLEKAEDDFGVDEDLDGSGAASA